MTRKSNQIFAAGLLLMGVYVSGCHRNEDKKTEIIPVTVTDISSENDNTAQIYAGAFQPRVTVDLAFTVGGYVRQIKQMRGADGNIRVLQSGDHVNKGDVLASVRLVDYESRVQQAQEQINGQQAMNMQARYGEQLSEEGLNRARIALVEATASANRSFAAINEAKAGLSASKHQVDEAVAGANLATIEYNRAKQLYENKALPKADYDAAKTQYDVAQTRVEQAKSQVDARHAQVTQCEQVYAATKATINGMKTQIRAAETQVKQAGAQFSASMASVNAARAQFTQASLPLDDAVLKSPVNGVILRRNIEIGNLASPGIPCFILADISSMKAVFGIPDTKLQDLHMGQRVNIQTESFSGKYLSGVITSIASDADPSSHQYPVEVTVPNPGGLIKSGMIAKLVLTEDRLASSGITIPLNSIFPMPDQPNEYGVYTIEADHSNIVARKRKILVGKIVKDNVIVLNGLQPGDQIISSGASLVYDGAKVTVVHD